MFKKLLGALEIALDQPSAIVAKLKGADARPFVVLSRPWIKSLGVETVIDVGANVGRWAKACRLAMPTVEICSFEPLPACVGEMRKRMEGDSRHRIYEMALGRTSTEGLLNVHAQLSSSSLLKETAEMTRLNVASRTVQMVPVKVTTIDKVNLRENWKPPFLLKLDVQGYELEVLAGAGDVLMDVIVIIVETSFAAMYYNQPIFADIHDFLLRAGFAYVGPAQTVLRSKNGLDVQQDSLFVRKSVLPQLGW